MKIYESKTLLAAMEKRSKEYQSTREQFVNLKKAFQGMADLGDDFEGKGADNIKAFYRDQAGIVDDWLDLIDMQVQFLDGVSAAVEEADLSGDTFIDMEFLENQLANAYKNSKSMVSQQKKDMKAILQSIHDILPLEVFSTETFKQHINDANDERKDAIKAVDDLDAALKEEYAASEINQQMVVADYTALIGATGKGKSASPIQYDAKAYRASEAYQLKDDVHKNAENYIQFKKDQAEARRIAKEQEELAKKQEELANRPWYEKVLDAGSTFVGEATGYYDYKRATEGVDPVTGEKLTYGQRVAAGAMGAAGYIPVVGWLGKGAKGIKGAYSMYKAEKAITTVDKALTAYKTPKTFQALKTSEKGLYGLTATNGFSETITGRDMFGNKISDEQRQNSLDRTLSMLGAYGLRGVNTKLNVKASSPTKSVNKKESDIIAERVKDFDLNPKKTPHKLLGSKKMSELNKKVKNRTITKEEWKRLEWNKRFKKRRDLGVDNFWEQERRRVQNNEEPTINWTKEQRESIESGHLPKHNGKTIIGHHTYSASKYPHLANKGEVIYPVTFKEHLYRWHGGSYKKSLPGKPLNPDYPRELE
ncbi:T7SS effector LXG polymorphic toxin [Bacillus sonorensis]|uniref:T7SS effector LXG polymorphic toxin n=1 Tax=Bacillus sonorensis TaxID=119858 RepID=UPI000E48D4B4|nr:T7SS effector LXG polymorphic toxin [Bacillus sonorensis]RHJ05896.1 hypothetical protein DW143_21350 [Bacillus sonorensis]